jgi:hypothetical protein
MHATSPSSDREIALIHVDYILTPIKEPAVSTEITAHLPFSGPLRLGIRRSRLGPSASASPIRDPNLVEHSILRLNWANLDTLTLAHCSNTAALLAQLTP